MIETIEFGKNYHWIILHTDFLTNDTADYQTLGLALPMPLTDMNVHIRNTKQIPILLRLFIMC